MDSKDTCHGLLCGGGGNSPYANIFPVNGLSTSGACNADQIRLIERSLHGDHCPSGTSLELDDTQTHLVGRKNGKIECSGQQLEGASFEIGTLAHQLALKIASVRPYTFNKKTYEGYRIEYNGQTACNYDTAVGILRELGFTHPAPPAIDMPPPDNYAPDPDDDLAIAMGGSVYDVNSGYVIYHAGTYFNLACVGDALAKTAFYDLGATEQGTSAALRMITARYANRHSYTERGMELLWTEFQDSAPEPKLEALWGREGKVLCLETPRLANLIVGGKPYDTRKLPKVLQPTGCEADAKSATPGRCEQAEWIDKLQTESGVHGVSCASVPPGDVALASYTDIAGKLLLSTKNQHPTRVTDPSSLRANAPTSPDPAAQK